jgi:hypothetical protein
LLRAFCAGSGVDPFFHALTQAIDFFFDALT